MRPSLSGKTVLLTGASRGIGAETARLLLSRGGRLVLTGQRRGPLMELAAALSSPDVLAIPCDVRDLAAMQDAVAQGIARFGGIDVVVANAGVVSYGSVLGVDPADVRRVIDTNVLGVFNTVRAALPSVMERQGYVLVVASLAAIGAMPGQAAYGASKAGAEHFANALRVEVDHRGVDVGVAYMSWIDTPMVRDASQDVSRFTQMVGSLPYPMNRITPVEVCAAAFVAGIARRRRHIYVPRWVGPLAAIRALVNTPASTRRTFRGVPEFLASMDEDVRRLGRSTSARVLESEESAEAG
jgi:NAD(P)-dependent dehydrogenase (short-subunit alcohol dehydrogenase family)